MNKAQKTLQPLIEKMSKGGFIGGYNLGVLDGLSTASNALASLADTMKLADVPTVEWETVGVGPLSYEHHKTAVVYPGCGYAIALCNNTMTYAKTVAKAKRYVEIKIYCAAIEQALIEELGGEK